MTRLQQARARQASHRAAQSELQSILDEVIDRLPLKRSEAFRAIVEYGIEGMATQRYYRSKPSLYQLIDWFCVKHDLV